MSSVLVLKLMVPHVCNKLICIQINKVIKLLFWKPILCLYLLHENTVKFSLVLFLNFDQ